MVYPPGIAFHPHLPERLGFSRLLALMSPELHRLLEATDPFTLVMRRNRVTLWREARRILRRNIPGDFVEIGVHRGGTAGILAQVLQSEPSRTLHLFDRWGDLPEPTPRDGFIAETYRKDLIPEKLSDLKDRPPLPDAKRLLQSVLGFPVAQTRYWEGWYKDTFRAYDGNRIAFASIDCDYYESVRDSLAFLTPLLAEGATIVLDDYSTWPGAKAAADEWLPTNAKLYPMPTGPAVIRLQGDWRSAGKCAER
ncbi:TylF/MycF/NovP-related O-methyltransferase [Sphingomonas sp. URHD0057]|uniref:TylF/MycF/NovP-related O-methyltransferase n=1 Tax=Sphingomonas sp. URHD0057 TaxID=1380389 RepID=UPI00049072D7|nr:TylF/MycF/NovP-related O-methyltransferase [Sphingomonas sp. URHD0057]